MIRTLTVFYLHRPHRLDGKNLPVVEYGLSDAFREFCRETFDARGPLDYPPLKLVTVNVADNLARALFTSGGPRGVLTDAGRACCLFLIDDDFMSDTVDGRPLRTWLKLFFPAVPKVLVTRPGHPDVPLPARRWTKKDFSVFTHPTKYHERIVHLFKSFWMPRFSTALRQYVTTKAGTNWHTPGHNGGRAFSNSPFLRGFYDSFGQTIFRTDLSVSVESLGDLSSPEARTPLSEAQKLTSEIFGTAQSCYITNGTSTSNKAMLMTLLRPGETVLIDRNCHKSVHHAVVTSGAVPHYLPARWNARLGVWGPVALEDIQRGLAAADTPRLLVLTTCTYEGVLYPVWEIARLCERAGVLFYADEAWAAHLNFHPFYTFGRGKDDTVRYSAVNETCGAHVSVQSTHKTLAAFSQASMIHVSTRFKQLLEEDASPAYRWLRKRFKLHGRGSYEKFSHDLHEILRYWHSTSPHYPFLAALDVAGVQMRLEGLKLIDERLRWTAAFRKRVADTCGKPENACFAGRHLQEGAPQGAHPVGEGQRHHAPLPRDGRHGGRALRVPLPRLPPAQEPDRHRARRAGGRETHRRGGERAAGGAAARRGALRRRTCANRGVRGAHRLAVPRAVPARHPRVHSRAAHYEGDDPARPRRNCHGWRERRARPLLPGRTRAILRGGPQPGRRDPRHASPLLTIPSLTGRELPPG